MPEKALASCAILVLGILFLIRMIRTSWNHEHRQENKEFWHFLQNLWEAGYGRFVWQSVTKYTWSEMITPKFIHCVIIYSYYLQAITLSTLLCVSHFLTYHDISMYMVFMAQEKHQPIHSHGCIPSKVEHVGSWWKVLCDPSTCMHLTFQKIVMKNIIYTDQPGFWGLNEVRMVQDHWQ